MTVFIDDAFLPFGRMLMSHMMADDLEELHQFAESIGLRRSWFQDKSIRHYDVSKGKREEAIAKGAVEVSFFDTEGSRNKDFAAMLRRERKRCKDQGGC